MEPVTVGVVLAALIAKALDRAEDGAVEGVVRAAGKAVDALRRRFSGDTDVEKALEGVVETPDSDKRVKVLADLLEARAGESAELREELGSIAKQIEAAGLRIGDIEQVIEGDGNAQVGGTINSQVNINQNTARRD